MKTSMYLLVCGIIAMSSLVVIGQEREIPESEYLAALRKTYDVTRALPVRITLSGEYYEKGAVSKKSKVVTERISPLHVRTFEQTSIDDKSETREAINLAGKLYCKENNKPWKVTDYFCGHSGMYSAAMNSVMNFYASKVELEGKRLTLYKLWVKEPPKPKAGFPDVFETKTWINSDGRIIKIERTSTISSTAAVVYSATELYEYNPKGLKIEAPIK